MRLLKCQIGQMKKILALCACDKWHLCWCYVTICAANNEINRMNKSMNGLKVAVERKFVNV